MRVIPVIDLKDGCVVRGVAGRREEYRPIESRLAADARPVSVATALVERFAFEEAYVADLDAIGGAEPDWRALDEIVRAGLRLLVDAGAGTPQKARQMAECAAVGQPPAGVIVGLESVESPAALAAVFAEIPAACGIFSLDLKDGRPLTSASAWRTHTAVEIAGRAAEIGFRQMIVLDLARVGTGQGTGVEPLCGQLRSAYPELQLIAGGGVRGVEDLRCLAVAGCGAALVASALHDAQLTCADLDRICRRDDC